MRRRARRRPSSTAAPSRCAKTYCFYTSTSKAACPPETALPGPSADGPTPVPSRSRRLARARQEPRLPQQRLPKLDPLLRLAARADRQRTLHNPPRKGWPRPRALTARALGQLCLEAQAVEATGRTSSRLASRSSPRTSRPACASSKAWARDSIDSRRAATRAAAPAIVATTSAPPQPRPRTRGRSPSPSPTRSTSPGRRGARATLTTSPSGTSAVAAQASPRPAPRPSSARARQRPPCLMNAPARTIVHPSKSLTKDNFSRAHLAKRGRGEAAKSKRADK